MMYPGPYEEPPEWPDTMAWWVIVIAALTILLGRTL